MEHITLSKYLRTLNLILAAAEQEKNLSVSYESDHMLVIRVLVISPDILGRRSKGMATMKQYYFMQAKKLFP